MDSQWRNVVGFENEYMISSNGEVYSILRKRLIKPKISPVGYLRVCLCRNGEHRYTFVHRIVAEAFIPNPEGKPTVNHKNEIKTDNRAENLEWMTVKENNNYGTRNQRAREHTDYKARGIDYYAIARKHDYRNMNNNQKTPVVQIDREGKAIKIYSGIGEAAREMNVSTAHIWECANNKRRTCKGYRWKYAEANDDKPV